MAWSSKAVSAMGGGLIVQVSCDYKGLSFWYVPAHGCLCGCGCRSASSRSSLGEVGRARNRTSGRASSSEDFASSADEFGETFVLFLWSTRCSWCRSAHSNGKWANANEAKLIWWDRVVYDVKLVVYGR